MTSELARVEQQKLEFEIEQHARERWWHEDRLVNQRTTWLIQMQTVFGGAFAYLQYRAAEVRTGIATLPSGANTADYQVILTQFSHGLQVLGICLGLALLLGIHAASTAQMKLQALYPDFTLGVTADTTRSGHVAAVAIPYGCLAAWLLSFVLVR